MNLDLDRIKAVADAATGEDGAAPLDEAAWLSLKAGDEGWRGVVTGDAFALTHGEDLHLVVHPDARGRGLGTSLLEGIEGPASAWSHGGHPAAADLAARFGFERVRDLWVMRRPMSEPLPPAPDTDIRAWTPADTDELLRVNAAAFAHHPEQGAS